MFSAHYSNAIIRSAGPLDLPSRFQFPLACDALTDDERAVCELVLQRETALAELRVALLPFVSFRSAGLQRPPLACIRVVLGVDQRVDVVVHPRERVLQPVVVLEQPLCARRL